MTYGIQVAQLSASGVAVNKRCHMKKMMAMHSSGSDAILKFYDKASVPGIDDPFYTFNAYGKGVFQVDMPGDGVFFNNGVYIDIPASLEVTVWYEEV